MAIFQNNDATPPTGAGYNPGDILQCPAGSPVAAWRYVGDDLWVVASEYEDAANQSAVSASRDLAKVDSGNVLICTSGSAIVLTIQNDAATGWSGLESIAAYQGGAGAVSFAAGSGVTLRGTAPTAAQYATQGVMRVGTNEWAYL